PRAGGDHGRASDRGRRASASRRPRKRAAEREPFGRRGMREEQQVGEARRREVAEVVPGEADMRALERVEVVREVERPAVVDAFPASRDRGEKRKARKLEACEEQKRDRELARRRRAEHRAQNEHTDGSAGDEEGREL